MTEDALVCREFVALVTEWYDGSLSGPVAFAMAAHLSTCVPCRTHYEQMRETVASLRRLRGVEPSIVPFAARPAP